MVTRIVRRFAEGSLMSLEGDLSTIRRLSIPGESQRPTQLLRRRTDDPIQDFIVVPVTPETVAVLEKRLLPRVGLRNRVLHVQLESGGELVFAAYDQFHPDCVWISETVGECFVESLRECGAVSGYRAAEI